MVVIKQNTIIKRAKKMSRDDEEKSALVLKAAVKRLDISENAFPIGSLHGNHVVHIQQWCDSSPLPLKKIVKISKYPWNPFNYQQLTRLFGRLK